MVMFNDVARVLETEFGITDVSPSRSLVSLDLDSLEMASLIVELENALGTDIPDDDLPKLVTLNDVVSYVNKKSN